MIPRSAASQQLSKALRNVHYQKVDEATQGKSVSGTDEDDYSTIITTHDGENIFVKKPYIMSHNLSSFKEDSVELINLAPRGVEVLTQASYIFKRSTYLTETATVDLLVSGLVYEEKNIDSAFAAVLDAREVTNVGHISHHITDEVKFAEITDALRVSLALRIREAGKQGKRLQTPLLTPVLAEVLRDYPGRSEEIIQYLLADEGVHKCPTYNVGILRGKLDCASSSLSSGVL